VIQVEQLTKIYGANTAIDHLDFTVAKGEIVGFLGVNGAGKSTTMRILAGALGATSGRALLGGVDVFQKPRAVKRLLGYLPEVPPLYTDMTVRQFLRFAARIKGAAKPVEATERAISRVALDSVAHRLIDHLSKGYRQRVGIAQALVHDPRILILDEPTSGLDPAQRVEIRNLVRELAGGDVTIILSTHVLSEVEAICKRVIIIDRGRIVAQDTLANLAGEGTAIRLKVARPSPGLADRLAAVPGVSSVQPGEDGGFVLAAASDVRESVARVAIDDGLLELTGNRGLEDVFLSLTGAAR
jgi:ABC-2 type transport system ATP-binding protein